MGVGRKKNLRQNGGNVGGVQKRKLKEIICAKIKLNNESKVVNFLVYRRRINAGE